MAPESSPASPPADIVQSQTRAWIEHAVVGLNLCPFAARPFARGLIRIAVSSATTPEALRDDLIRELRLLAEADPDAIETTLLVHPGVLTDFTDYNDFLDVADLCVTRCGLDGEIQVASFHPDYQFAGTRPQDIENATNRAPWPTLHLLREASISAAVEAVPDTDAIFEANVRRLQALGPAGWTALQSRWRGGGPGPEDRGPGDPAAEDRPSAEDPPTAADLPPPADRR